MKKILVTGGAGFIGSFVTDMLLEQGYRVTLFDNIEPQVHVGGKVPSYVNKEARLIVGDVRNRKELQQALGDNDAVIHLAAMVGVGQSQYQIDKYTSVNIGGTAMLLDILANTKHKVKKLLTAGSMSSYGEGLYRCPSCGLVRPPLRTEGQMKQRRWELYCPECRKKVTPVLITEDQPLHCNSVYALTKKVQEEMCLIFGEAYRVPTVVLRLFNVFGPRQSLSNPYTGVAAIFSSRVKNDNPPVIFEDGLQSRDFVYVTDVANAFVTALKDKRADYGVFNVGTGRPVTIKQIAEVIARSHGKKIAPQITRKFRKGDVRHCISDITKIRKALGYKPQVSFEEGIRRLNEWSKDEIAFDRYEQSFRQLREKGLV